MSYVDLMGNVRWTEPDHIERVEASVRSSTTHTREHVVIRRTLGFLFYIVAQMLPAGHPAKPLLASKGEPLSDAAMAELTAAAAVFNAADVLAVEARADSARLDLALNYEEAQAALAPLADRPYPPRTDYPAGAAGNAAYTEACASVDKLNAADAEARAAKRAAPQAVVNAATQDTLDLVAQRAAFRARMQPALAPAPAPAP